MLRHNFTILFEIRRDTLREGSQQCHQMKQGGESRIN